MTFEWDDQKDRLNLAKHGVDFTQAMAVFSDPTRVVTPDPAHSTTEPRFYCIGQIGDRICTVRFTLRSGNIRILGAGFWRSGRKLYHEK